MVDWLALLVSLVAIFVTFRELRRNNSVCLYVEDCQSFSRQSERENNRQFYNQFVVKIRNQGMSVYGLSAAICFRSPDGGGTMTCPIRRKPLSGDRDEMCKGMVAEFYLKSFELSGIEKGFLSVLKSTRTQNATLNFYSQNYLCASFPIYRRSVWCKKKWNYFAHRINYAFTRQVGRSAEGMAIVHTPTLIPSFKIGIDRLNEFIALIQEDQKMSRSSDP